jgi:hypothetical protein
MHLHLGGHDAGKDPAAIPHHSGGGFVTGSFEAKK